MGDGYYPKTYLIFTLAEDENRESRNRTEFPEDYNTLVEKLANHPNQFLKPRSPIPYPILRFIFGEKEQFTPDELGKLEQDIAAYRAKTPQPF